MSHANSLISLVIEDYFRDKIFYKQSKIKKKPHWLAIKARNKFKLSDYASPAEFRAPLASLVQSYFTISQSFMSDDNTPFYQN